jgi:endogenous inhibitor of DNA gyrase (YacG/DUF329 family)
MTTLEETLKHDLIAHLTAPAPKTQRAHCMTCGRALDPAKAAAGERARFCSDRCMSAYDAGWPVYGTAVADYATETAHRKPVAAPMTKAKRKPRKRTLQPRIAA